MKAGKINCGDYVLCIKDRIHNDDIVHKKGNKYLVTDVFIDANKHRIIQLISDINIDVQYAYNKYDNSIFVFIDYFFTIESRKIKIEKILKEF